MNLLLDKNIPEKYHSNSQRARVITERWMRSNMFCPSCGVEHIIQFEANRPVADFFCDRCKQEFELKSKASTSLGGTIADGAYNTMIERITSNNNPNLFYMTHDGSAVNNLIFIPRYFFTPSIIEKRKALKESAQRAGWEGCNINISGLPKESMIFIVKSGVISDRNVVLSECDRIKSLQTDNIESRGWIMDVLLCINNIPDAIFGTEQIYAFEEFLHEKHPNNSFIEAKIRQQLQLLRDKGYIKFLSGGGISCQSGLVVCVDKGEWDKSMSPEEVDNFNYRWISACREHMKPNATIWISGTHHNIFSVQQQLLKLGFKNISENLELTNLFCIFVSFH